MRFFIVSILLWIVAYSLPEYLDSPLISDKLIESVYYGGKKVNKITYEDLKNRNNTEAAGGMDSEINIIENYYSNYIHQMNSMIQNQSEDLEIENVNLLRDQDKVYKYTDSGLKGDSVYSDYYKNKINTGKSNFNGVNNSGSRPPGFRSETEEKMQFSKNLYMLYGNKTIFNMDLNDLEKTVHSAIMTDGQAVIFWESLLQMKTDRAKIISGKLQNELDTEYYLFNILGIKSISLVILTLLIFIVTHKIQVHAIKNFFVYNLISTCLTFYIMDNLYLWRYYVSCSIMFVQFGLCVKYILYSFVSNIGYNSEDYDIFSNFHKTRTVTQFLLKFNISTVTTFIIGVLALTKYKFFFNYILFYICLIHFMYMVSFFLQNEVPFIFQPLKHLIFVLVGVVNFLLSNFHRRISKSSNYSSNGVKENNDSFYIVSETFSFICISYLFEYLNAQVKGKLEYQIEKEAETDECAKKISSLTNTLKEHEKNFKISEDAPWLIVFSFGIILSLVGVIKGRYLTFLFSLQYFKIVFKVFGNIFKVKLLRCAIGLMLLILILGNQLVSNKKDTALFDSMNISNQTTISFIKFLVRLSGLLFIILMILANFEYIILMNEKRGEFGEADEVNIEPNFRKVEISTTYDKKKKKKIKTIEIQIVKEDRTPFSFVNIVYIQFDLFTNYTLICLIFYIIRDQEKNYFIIIFYSLLVSILFLRVNF